MSTLKQITIIIKSMNIFHFNENETNSKKIFHQDFSIQKPNVHCACTHIRVDTPVNSLRADFFLSYFHFVRMWIHGLCCFPLSPFIYGILSFVAVDRILFFPRTFDLRLCMHSLIRTHVDITLIAVCYLNLLLQVGCTHKKIYYE